MTNFEKRISMFLLGCSAVLSCSRSEDCGMPYPLDDDAYSGAGYVEISSVQDGELCFMVSSDTGKDTQLTVRGRGSANAEIVTEANIYPLSFDEEHLWEEVTITVHLNAGKNSIRIKKCADAGTTLHIDYMELDGLD